jgi:predicted nucleotidyltransferase component of viral defense system
MITHQEIKNLVTEWGLREDVIEKDYVIGWLLWGLGSDPDLQQTWAFKGGTALKKCYIETWRFSEDLDFTVLPGGPVAPEEIKPIISRVLERIHEESGIDFSVGEPTYKYFDQFNSTQGNIYYRGPRNTPSPSRVKLDISGVEIIARPTVFRDIAHGYSDGLPGQAQVRCYAFEEVFAEKIRAMGERGRPRDLYDIVLLYRRRDIQSQPKVIYEVLQEKCKSKGLTCPTLDSIQNAESKQELISEWENMLGHQLQTLPPFEQFWEELPNIFTWLGGVAEPAQLASIGYAKDEDTRWTPPPTVRSWGMGIPLESVRFAAINHLCVELGYDGRKRLIEPYSLRRTKDDNLILHAIKVKTREHRCYRVDRIESIKVTTQTFIPKYAIEFSSIGMIHAQPTQRKTDLSHYGSFGGLSSSIRSRQSLGSSGMKYIFECSVCGKKFTKTTFDSMLRKHKDKSGMPCFGTMGIFMGNK